jgi:hypothetical protein
MSITTILKPAQRARLLAMLGRVVRAAASAAASQIADELARPGGIGPRTRRRSLP